MIWYGNNEGAGWAIAAAIRAVFEVAAATLKSSGRPILFCKQAIHSFSLRDRQHAVAAIRSSAILSELVHVVATQPSQIGRDT